MATYHNVRCEVEFIVERRHEETDEEVLARLQRMVKSNFNGQWVSTSHPKIVHTVEDK